MYMQSVPVVVQPKPKFVLKSNKAKKTAILVAFSITLFLLIAILTALLVILIRPPKDNKSPVDKINHFSGERELTFQSN